MNADEVKKCMICNRGLMHSGIPIFFQIKVNHMCLDLNAIRRLHGTELMLGSPALARIMSPNVEIAKKVAEYPDVILCHDCAMSSDVTFMRIFEELTDGEKSAADQPEGG